MQSDFVKVSYVMLRKDGSERYRKSTNLSRKHIIQYLGQYEVMRELSEAVCRNEVKEAYLKINDNKFYLYLEQPYYIVGYWQQCFVDNKSFYIDLLHPLVQKFIENETIINEVFQNAYFCFCIKSGMTKPVYGEWLLQHYMNTDYITRLIPFSTFIKRAQIAAPENTPEFLMECVWYAENIINKTCLDDLPLRLKQLAPYCSQGAYMDWVARNFPNANSMYPEILKAYRQYICDNVMPDVTPIDFVSVLDCEVPIV